MKEKESIWGSTGRPVIHAKQGVISSGHYLTSMAGMQILIKGGNAFDALVAAGFAAAVFEPTASYSLGAEGVFMLYDAESGDLLSLSGQGCAPAKATIDFYKSQNLDCIPKGPGPLGHLAITVPGVVDAYISLLERYGTKKLSDVLESVIYYADAGFPFYEYMLHRLNPEKIGEQSRNFPPGCMEIFFRNGTHAQPGSLLVQKSLGNTLRKMVEAESREPGNRQAGLKAARDLFYRGEIAKSIIDYAQSVGGILSLEDLENYHAKFDQPIRCTFGGYEICGHSTWTQSAVLMQALNILEGFDLKSMGHNSPRYIHTIVEAFKLAFADRAAYYGDPDFSTIPIDGLIAKDYSAERAALIDENRAYPELPPAGNPWPFSLYEGKQVSNSMTPHTNPTEQNDHQHGTTHIAVMDERGNMVCATPSGGALADAVFFPELGCTLSTRIEMFNLENDHPNRVEPGKRPRTTLVNYILLKEGKPEMTIGCPGGDHQSQACLQLILNTLLFKMNPQEAVEAPRFGTDSMPDSFYPHDYFAGQLALEEGFSAETEASLKALGHKIVHKEVCGMGATVARRDPDTGMLSTGADQRRSCYALGW